MESNKNNLDNGNKLLKYTSFTTIKQIVQALRHTARRGTFLDPKKYELYTNLTNRIFTWNILDRKALEDFVMRTINDLNNVKWEEHMGENWFLKGTLLEDGNTWDHTKWQRRVLLKYAKKDLEAWLYAENDYRLLNTAVDEHDIWEWPRGDTVFDQKNNSGEDFEKKCGIILLDWILNEESKKDEKIYAHVQEAYEINFDKNHHLNPFFLIYEKYSYLTGSFIARKNPDSIEYPEKLINNVLRNQLKHIKANIDLPSMKAFVTDNMHEFQANIDFLRRIHPSTYKEKDLPEGFEEQLKSHRSSWEEIKLNFCSL